MSEHNPKYVEALKRGKLDYSVVPWPALRGLALAMQEGADKYGRFNYRQDKIEARTYIAAILRHLFGDPSTGSDGWINGEDIDAESGLHHLTKVMACCALVLDAEDHGMLIDNRLDTESKEPPSMRGVEDALQVDMAEAEARVAAWIDSLEKADGAEYDFRVPGTAGGCLAGWNPEGLIEDDGFITRDCDLVQRTLDVAAVRDTHAKEKARKIALELGGPGWYVEFADEEADIGKTFLTICGPYVTETDARVFALENPENFAGRRVIFNNT